MAELTVPLTPGVSSSSAGFEISKLFTQPLRAVNYEATTSVLSHMGGTKKNETHEREACP